jgi:hypothetical protein
LPDFEADYIRLVARLRMRGTPTDAFRDMVLNSVQGKIYVNYGLGNRGSIPVTRNTLSSPSYPDSFFNSLRVLSSDYKGHVLRRIVADPEAGHTPPPNIDVRNTLNVTLSLTHVVIITCTALIFTDVFPPFEKHFTGS